MSLRFQLFHLFNLVSLIANTGTAQLNKHTSMLLKERTIERNTFVRKDPAPLNVTSQFAFYTSLDS